MKLIKTAIFAALIFATQTTFGQFKQTPLRYSLDALEGAIDTETMNIHYNKHAAAYTSNLNNAIAGTPAEKKSIEEILMTISTQPVAVRNNGGGHYNHELFWTVLTPNKGSKPSPALKKAIDNKFGSIDAMKEQINKAGATRFGSGWAWLSVDENGDLFVSSTANQDNPLMDVVEVNGTPILGIDVWEHAYYLRYQNKRADYLNTIWEIVDWNEVSNRYDKALKK